jgi:hypothetical protein
MTQKEIIKYFDEIGGLRCKYWTNKEIKEYIKNTLNCKRVYKSTCYYLKRSAIMYQR